MINPFEQINWKPEEKDIKSFGISMITGFTCISLVFLLVQLFRTSDHESLFLPISLFLFGAVIYILTRTLPKLVLPVYFVWFFLSACIGIVISNLILIIFFYLIFTPFSLVLRAVTGRDPLKIRRRDVNTYWVSAVKGSKLSRYLKQY